MGRRNEELFIIARMLERRNEGLLLLMERMMERRSKGLLLIMERMERRNEVLLHIVERMLERRNVRLMSCQIGKQEHYVRSSSMRDAQTFSLSNSVNLFLVILFFNYFTHLFSYYKYT